MKITKTTQHWSPIEPRDALFVGRNASSKRISLKRNNLFYVFEKRIPNVKLAEMAKHRHLVQSYFFRNETTILPAPAFEAPYPNKGIVCVKCILRTAPNGKKISIHKLCMFVCLSVHLHVFIYTYLPLFLPLFRPV